MLAYTYDVFISSSSRDVDWVQAELLPRLERHGLRVCCTARDFRAGAPHAAEIEIAIQHSRHTLLVLTPDYLRSGWTAFERTLLQTLDPAGRARRLIPLLKTPCALPLSIEYLTRVDFTSGQEWARLLDALADPAVPQTPDDIPLDALPALAALPSRSRMPLSRNPLFVGRERELHNLACLLKGGATAVIDQLVATTGLGGIGKTQLASEFVHRYGQFFPGGVFWLSFEHAEAVPAEIARCGGAGYLDLRPNFANLMLDEQVRLVLQAWQLDVPRLLVFDNCEDETLLDRWRPRYGGCRVLVTSRRAQWSKMLGVQALRLETLPRAESIELLRKHRPDIAPDDPALDMLADYLGDLPLALDVAGSYLARYQDDLDPAEYLAELQAAGGIDAELLAAEGISATGHDQNVMRTFKLSYDKLDAASPTDALALRLLARAACCAPGEPLPRDLLLATASIDSHDKKATRPATRALGRLSELGLLEIESAGDLWMHRLLAAFVRAVSLDRDAQAAVEQTVLKTSRHLNHIADRRAMALLQPHLHAVTDTAQKRLDERSVELCQRLGNALTLLGDFAGARLYYERALAIREQALEIIHPVTAEYLNKIAGLLLRQEDAHGAQPYLERALEIVDQVGAMPPLVMGHILNNVGILLLAQGGPHAAQPYIQEALAIWTEGHGPTHPSTAECLHNLGVVLRAQGQYTEARFYLERALALRLDLLGTEHPSTARSMHSLGVVLREQGQYAAARSYLEQALMIRVDMLGEDHRATVESLNSLGQLLQAQGDMAEARSYLERALAIVEQRLDPNRATTRAICLASAPLNAALRTIAAPL